MTNPAPDRVPTTFMAQRGMNPTTKLIYLGAAVVFMASVFWLGRAYMMMNEQEPAAPTAPAQMPPLPPPLTGATGSATSAQAATAVSAEAADRPIQAAPELSQTLSGAKLTPTPAAPVAADQLPSFKKQDIDLSRGEALLDDVRDHTFGVDEAAFYWLVEAVNTLPASRFTPEPPEKHVTIGKLCEFPRTYRGQPVTLSLMAGKVEPFGPSLAHAPGVKKLWVIEAYQTPFVGEAPVCEIILTENPGNVEPQTPFLVRGYFYKVRSYDKLHDDGDIWVHQSPLIIAKTIEVIPPATEINGTFTDAFSGKNSSLALGGVVAMVLVIFMLVRRVMAVRARMPTLEAKQELTPEQIAERVEYLKHEETAPPSAQADEEIDPIELARRRDEALAKFEEQARKKK